MTIPVFTAPLARHLSPVMPVNTPFPNVTPFTVRDNATFTMVLQDMRGWFEESLYPFVSESIKDLAESWIDNASKLVELVNDALDGQASDIQDLINKNIVDVTKLITDQNAEFNSIVQQIVNSSIQLQSPVVAAILKDRTSPGRIALDQILAKYLAADPNDPLMYKLTPSPII